MIEISKPSEATYWIAHNADGSVLHRGITEPDQVTTTGQPTLDKTTSDSENLKNLESYSEKFPALPESGELIEGDIYRDGDTLYQVRQTHERTKFEPTETPALFIWHRDDGSIDWVAGERVLFGTVRTYLTIDYKCIQKHVTQDDWTPDRTPALWQAVVVDVIPDWVQPTGAHDAYALGAIVNHNRKTWKSTVPANVWEPGVFGWNEHTDDPKLRRSNP